MICDFLDKYNEGILSEPEFKKHASNCSSCQEVLDLDEEVMSFAKSLRQHIEAPFLWSRIEKSMMEEMAKEHRFKEKDKARKSPWRLFRLASAMAAIILVVWLGFHFFIDNRTPSSGLIAKNTFARVEKKEQEYIRAIQDLEKRVQPKIADMDLQMVFLYRDRLETIDAQIEQCQEDLAFNPANAHIRRFLMMALHDKKETLAEILNPEKKN